MVIGAALAWGGLSLPGVETGIMFSLLVAGILIVTLTKLPTAVGGSLVGAFCCSTVLPTVMKCPQTRPLPLT